MPNKVVARNRKATHDYFILETYEAGIVLTGTEIKSVREGRVNLRDGYAKIDNGELWLYNVHIAHERGSFSNHDPLRPRKKPLRREEISVYWENQGKGLTLVPLSVYIKDNRWAKVEVAQAKERSSTISERP